MDRRRYLQMTAIGLGTALSGCLHSEDQKSTTTKEHNKVMSILPEVRKVSDGWLLEATVLNVYPQDTSFHEIKLLAYTADGNKVCEGRVGDLLKPTGDRETIQVTCSGFPAIITATARESPCQNGLIPVDYWVGTDAQKTGTVADDELLWKDTYRKCGEELPPQRILDKFEASSTKTE